MDIPQSDGLPPSEARQCLVEAQALIEEGRLGAAVQKCERALHLSPNWAEAHFLYGVIQERMGFFIEAQIAYERASHPAVVSRDLWATHAEPDPAVRQLLAEAHEARHKGKLGSALRKCKAALRLAPDCAEAHNLRGVVLDDMGHSEQAIAAYREAVRLVPSFSKARLDLVRAGDTFSNFVTIRTFAFPSQAHIARARLQVEGIPSFIVQDDIVSLNWFFLYMVRWVKLCVWQQDAEKALAILDWTWAEESDFEPCCPRCGSTNVHYEKYNLRLVYAAILLFRIPIPIKRERWSCRRCGTTWKASCLCHC